MTFDRLLFFFFLGTRKINWKEILLESTLSQLNCAKNNYKGEYFYLPQFFFLIIMHS